MPEEIKHLPSQDVADSQRRGDRRLSPCSVSLTQREVIENKLLAALEDESCTAILTSKEDLEILISALESWNWGNNSTHRSMDLAAGITQLRDEAFPQNAKADLPPKKGGDSTSDVTGG